jgi:methanogen homocitrate synthase
MKISMEEYIKKLPPRYGEIFSKGLIHNYAIEAVGDKLNFAKAVNVGDTTLRDGEQQPGVFFTPEQKLEIAMKLAEAGVRTAEIGYPAVSDDEMRACKMIAKEKIQLMSIVMARAKKDDIDAAMAADAKILDLFTSCSEFHIRYKLKLTPEQNMEMYLDAVDYAVDHGLFIVFGREDDSRAHIPYFVELVSKTKERAKARFISTGVSDTTGFLTPMSARWLVETLKAKLPKVDFILHFHNDLGMAVANTISGLEAGASGVSGTVMGIGERTGNCPLEEVVIALKTIYGIDVGFKTEKLLELGKLVSKYAGIPIPVNKPIFGMNAFRHESGIHAAGVLAHNLVYECIPAEWLGRKSEYRYGKFSGTAVVLKEALEPYGITPTREQLLEIVRRVKEEHESGSKKELEEFVETYYSTMDRMGLKIEEVVEIAKAVCIKK